jgi:hypothetical protein
LDLRVIEEQSYAAVLQHFTGSKEHNIALRKEAIKKGYTLNEYGLFEDSASGGEGVMPERRGDLQPARHGLHTSRAQRELGRRSRLPRQESCLF